MTYFQFTSKGNLTHDTLHEGRFSFAVLSHKGHFFTSLDCECHMIEDGMGTIVLSDFVADHWVIPTTQTRREFQVHRRVVDLVDLDRHDLLQLLDFLLHLDSLRSLITETLDEVLHLCHFLLLILVGSQLLFTALLTKHDVFIVFHLVVDNPSTGDLQRSI